MTQIPIQILIEKTASFMFTRKKFSVIELMKNKKIFRYDQSVVEKVFKFGFSPSIETAARFSQIWYN